MPVRTIFEALGANVVWDDSSQTVISNKSKIEIKLTIGSNVMTINGKEKVLDVSPQIISGRTLVPVRAIAESFDVAVDYNTTLKLFCCAVNKVNISNNAKSKKL